MGACLLYNKPCLHDCLIVTTTLMPKYTIAEEYQMLKWSTAVKEVSRQGHYN